MKNKTIKTLIATCVAVIIATGVFASHDMKTIMENIRVQQQAVNQDLVKVNQLQVKVKQLGKQCRESHGSAAIHKEYKDAKAELRSYKAQLKEDDSKLMEAHEAHIKAHKDEVRAEVRVFERVQRNLDRDKAKRKPATLTEADQVMTARAELRNRLTALERSRLGRDKDRWILNREYGDRGAKTSYQLSMEGETKDIDRAQK